MAKEREWPRVRGNPTAIYATAQGYLISDRQVAGPLRMGTAPGVGPRGRGGGGGDSDFGMDRLEHAPVDRVGVKYPEVDPPVPLLSRRMRER